MKRVESRKVKEKQIIKGLIQMNMNIKNKCVRFESRQHADGSITLYRHIEDKLDTFDCTDLEVAKAVARRLSGFESLVSKKKTRKYQKAVDEIVSKLERHEELGE